MSVGNGRNIKMEQGLKHDQDKIRTELFPIEAFMGTCKVLSFGARKYNDRNWERGMLYSRVYGALLRHLMAWFSGEDADEETGYSHLHHAGCCIAFLQTYAERGMTEFDDRPVKGYDKVTEDDKLSTQVVGTRKEIYIDGSTAKEIASAQQKLRKEKRNTDSLSGLHGSRRRDYTHWNATMFSLWW